MDRRLEIALVAVAVVLVLLVGVVAVGFYQFTRPIPDSYTHTYEYRTYIQPDETLTNVTLYLPLPVENGSSPAGDALVGGSPGVTDAPPGWSFAVEDTSAGPMLALSFPELAPTYYERQPPRSLEPGAGTPTRGETPTGTPIRSLDYYLVSVEWASEEPIDTRSPVGNEPTLQPRLNATETPCDGPTTEGQACRRFGSWMYLSYDAPANATLDVLVTYEGYNEWFAGGWTGTLFRQSTRTVVVGDGPGWIAADGEEEVGVGTYRGAPQAVPAQAA
ncbi:hypothetical protein HUG10_11280 [Halorarum halophilum]|uniref:Uncharacterized protein n=1 Tax=Halorarum halophilum TaxID=2743090 RepID=A0A7D5KUX5_9EURY|nr:hypothetical protein [Halobaculum halophilum]QLG28100.1 hypothetical protein HUG10_11280 [Halobaculum halophilum]